jgi:hypothetical protein
MTLLIMTLLIITLVIISLLIITLHRIMVILRTLNVGDITHNDITYH